MKQYLEMARHVLNRGVVKKDRTGTGTLSTFGYQMRFNLQEGFPLVTTKKCHLRSIIHELLWFLKGDTNTQYLNDNEVTIWDEWALKEDETENYELSNPDRASYAVMHGLTDMGGSSLIAHLNHLGVEEGGKYLDNLGVPRGEVYVVRKKGDLGPVYGKQWRDWVGPGGKHHDQITAVINQLKNDPDSRRIIVSAWNVGELDQMALHPCHSFFQFYTRELSVDERSGFIDEEQHRQLFIDRPAGAANGAFDKVEWYHTEFDKLNIPRRALSCQLYQRSADVFLGVPFNIASYALLIYMVAQQVNMVADEFIWTGGDVHLYSNHMDQIKEQLTREPLPLPTLFIKHKPASIFEYNFIDFEIVGYESHPAIKAPVAI